MNTIDFLNERSGGICELTGTTENLTIYPVLPNDGKSNEQNILVTEAVVAQLDRKEALDSAFWQNHLPTSMWSDVPAVQVTVWRLLQRLKGETWASENLDMIYLDEETLTWAQTDFDADGDVVSEFHVDANGARLETGDSVVLTKTLDVKGSTISARIGTVVKNIRLVADNADQIEGKVEGQQIVILTKYVRKHS